jgi:hypothetical protein
MLVLHFKNPWSNFERESELKSSTARLRNFMRINTIHMKLRSAISAALTPKLSQGFLKWSTSEQFY